LELQEHPPNALYSAWHILPGEWHGSKGVVIGIARGGGTARQTQTSAIAVRARVELVPFPVVRHRGISRQRAPHRRWTRRRTAGPSTSSDDSLRASSDCAQSLWLFSKLPKIDAANKAVTTTKSSKIQKSHKLSGWT